MAFVAFIVIILCIVFATVILDFISQLGFILYCWLKGNDRPAVQYHDRRIPMTAAEVRKTYQKEHQQWKKEFRRRG